MKLCMWIGVQEIINHIKFGNDNQLSEYTVSKGQISHCSIGIDCRLSVYLYQLRHTIVVALIARKDNMLLSKVSVLFLQQHRLSGDHLQSLGNIDSRFLYSGVFGFGNSEVLQGRPYGSCTLLWRSDLCASVTLATVQSRRACAVCMVSGTYRMLRSYRILRTAMTRQHSTTTSGLSMGREILAAFQSDLQTARPSSQIVKAYCLGGLITSMAYSISRQPLTRQY